MLKKWKQKRKIKSKKCVLVSLHSHSSHFSSQLGFIFLTSPSPVLTQLHCIHYCQACVNCCASPSSTTASVRDLSLHALSPPLHYVAVVSSTTTPPVTAGRYCSQIPLIFFSKSLFEDFPHSFLYMLFNFCLCFNFLLLNSDCESLIWSCCLCWFLAG